MNKAVKMKTLKKEMGKWMKQTGSQVYQYDAVDCVDIDTMYH